MCACLKNSKEASVAGAKMARGCMAGEEGLEVKETCFSWVSEAIVAFPLSKSHCGF